MKTLFQKLFTIFVLLVANISIAQDGYQAVRTKLNDVFLPINKSQIPTGILHEYGYQLADLPTWTQVIL